MTPDHPSGASPPPPPPPLELGAFQLPCQPLGPSHHLWAPHDPTHCPGMLLDGATARIARDGLGTPSLLLVLRVRCPDTPPFYIWPLLHCNAFRLASPICLYMSSPRRRDRTLLSARLGLQSGIGGCTTLRDGTNRYSQGTCTV